MLRDDTGCGQSVAEFHLDMIEAKKDKISFQQQQQIADILTAMFGTPDAPFVLPQTGLDLEKITLASGPVNRGARAAPAGCSANIACIATASRATARDRRPYS